MAEEEQLLRQRYSHESDPDWDQDLPYGGKVYLARRKKPDPIWVKIVEVSIYTLDIYGRERKYRPSNQ